MDLGLLPVELATILLERLVRVLSEIYSAAVVLTVVVAVSAENLTVATGCCLYMYGMPLILVYGRLVYGATDATVVHK